MKLNQHKNYFEKFLTKSNVSFLERWNSKITTMSTENDITIGDFELLKTIGSGAFGVVLLIKGKNEPFTHYALKLIEKKLAVKNSHVAHVKTEVKLICCIDFVFIIKMEHFFMDNVYLYMIMPFVNGGEMFKHLRQLKRFDENVSRFYSSQIVLTLEYLHFNGIVYRDLKPENILITADGYLKVCDFGFSKRIGNNRTYTLCGTPDYLSPEVILSKGHGFSVDWWSLGILIYEMMAGQPPFEASTHIKLYDKILKCDFRFPSFFSAAAKGLIKHFLTADISLRFGCLRRGALDIKEHQWYRQLDWNAILNRQLKAPFKPTVFGSDDTTHFDVINTEPVLRNCSFNEYDYAFADFDLA